MLGPKEQTEEVKFKAYKKMSEGQIKRKLSGLMKRGETALYKITTISVESLARGHQIGLVMYDSFESEKGEQYRGKGSNIFYVILSRDITYYQYKVKDNLDYSRCQFGKGKEEDCLKHAINYYIKRLRRYAKEVHIKFEKKEYKEIREFLRTSVKEMIK